MNRQKQNRTGHCLVSQGGDRPFAPNLVPILHTFALFAIATPDIYLPHLLFFQTLSGRGRGNPTQDRTPTRQTHPPAFPMTCVILPTYHPKLPSWLPCPGVDLACFWVEDYTTYYPTPPTCQWYARTLQPHRRSLPLLIAYPS